MRWRQRWRTEGINSLATSYRVLSESNESLYTNITVDLGVAPTYQQMLKLTEDHRPESFSW